MESSYAELPPNMKFAFCICDYFRKATRFPWANWSICGLPREQFSCEMQKIWRKLQHMVWNNFWAEMCFRWQWWPLMRESKLSNAWFIVRACNQKGKRWKFFVRSMPWDMMKYQLNPCTLLFIFFLGITNILSILHLISDLLFFNVHKYYRIVSLTFISFRELRILDLENVNIKCLPQEIGEVRLLRYLYPREIVTERLPHSFVAYKT